MMDGLRVSMWLGSAAEQGAALKPPAFGYVRPETLQEALDFFPDHEGPGGQSLIAALNMR